MHCHNDIYYIIDDISYSHGHAQVGRRVQSFSGLGKNSYASLYHLVRKVELIATSSASIAG